MFLKILKNSQGNTCARVSFLIKLQVSGCNFIKKETLACMFPCEFSEIFKNTLFTHITSNGYFCSNNWYSLWVLNPFVYWCTYFGLLVSNIIKSSIPCTVAYKIGLHVRYGSNSWFVKTVERECLLSNVWNEICKGKWF